MPTNPTDRDRELARAFIRDWHDDSGSNEYTDDDLSEEFDMAIRFARAVREWLERIPGTGPMRVVDLDAEIRPTEGDRPMTDDTDTRRDEGKPAQGEREECARTVFPWWDDVMPSARLDLAVNSALAMLEQHDAARQSSAAEIERLERWIDDCQSGMYINCVYCGHRYGPDDGDHLKSMREALHEHVAQCPKHPLSKANAELERLRGERQKYVDAHASVKGGLVELKRQLKQAEAEVAKLSRQVLEAHAKLESAHAETSAAEAERDATRDDRSTTGDCR